MLLRSAVGMAAPQATVPALGAAELVGAALEAFATDPESQAAGEDNTFEHHASLVGADNGVTDPGTAKSDEINAGGAEIASRTRHADDHLPEACPRVRILPNDRSTR